MPVEVGEEVQAEAEVFSPSFVATCPGHAPRTEKDDPGRRKFLGVGASRCLPYGLLGVPPLEAEGR